MEGRKQPDGSIIWQDGSQTFPDTALDPKPPGTYPWPVPGTPVQGAQAPKAPPPMSPNQNPGPFPPVVYTPPPCVLHGKRFPPSISVGNLPPQYSPGQLMIVWEDGSGEYAPQKGAAQKPPDPPGSHPYPPSMPGTTDVTKTIPCPPAPQQTNEPPSPPITVQAPEIAPLSAAPTPAELWDRWQKIVAGWQCLTTWAGGLDKINGLLAAVPLNVPVYAKGTATAAWAGLLAAGADKAPTVAAVGLDVAGIQEAIREINDTFVLARIAGYKDCPPAPGTLASAKETVTGWWGGLTPGKKIIAGGGAVVLVGLLVRGAAK